MQVMAYAPSIILHTTNEGPSRYVAEKIIDLLKETGCDLSMSVATVANKGHVNLPPVTISLHVTHVEQVTLSDRIVATSEPEGSE